MTQGMLFFRMLINGMCFCCSYDLLRAARRVFRHRTIHVAIEDFFFTCVSIPQLIYIVQVYCEGNIRFYAIYGLLVGAILYLYTISSVWIFLIYHILLVAKKCSKNMKKMLKKAAKTVKIMVNLEKCRKHEK